MKNMRVTIIYSDEEFTYKECRLNPNYSNVNLSLPNKLKIIDQIMTHKFIAQSIVRAPDFLGHNEWQ